MFFSFVSFITNFGLFWTCLENIVYDDALWRHDYFKDSIGIFFLNSSFGVKRRVLRAEENQGPRERLCTTFSSADNSIIVLLFACLVLSVLTEKSKNYMRGLYDYAITPSRTFEQTRLSQHLCKKYSAANDWDFLMYVQLSSCVQGAYYEWDTYAKIKKQLPSELLAGRQCSCRVSKI